MNILIVTDNLMTRSQLEDTWVKAGAVVVVNEPGPAPDLVAVDLTAPAAHERIAQLRAAYPDAHILAFGPHVDGEAFKQARASGADAGVARGKVVERVLAKLRGTSA